MESRVCANCKQPAKQQCPVCLKNPVLAGSPTSFFCSQDCFKKVWSVHKVVHSLAESSGNESNNAYNPWPGFRFSGSLRPFPYGPQRPVPDAIKRPDYAATGIPYSEMRQRGSTHVTPLSDEEIKKMRKVCKIGRQALDLGAQAIKAGVTTDEIDRVVHEFLIENDCYPSPLNYNNFPKSICTSVNEVICHGIPDTRPLQEGDIVNLDISVYHDGFHTDLNETFFVGEVDEASKHLVYTARECLEKAMEIAAPGVPYKDFGNVIEKHARENNVSVVRSFCGHGVHKLFHTTPNIPHYAKNKAVGVCRPGHTFTIEPMINAGSYHDMQWPDNWTAVTADGKRSAQFEQTILITPTGYEVLTASDQFADSTFSSPYPPAYAHLRPSTTSNARPPKPEQQKQSSS